ncbi:MAG: substrate-binding domain-containing protein [Acidimicrobiia bacterium]
MKRRLAWLTPFLALSLLAAACGDDDDDAGSDNSGEGSGGAVGDCPEVDGDVNISGSSTVEPISAAVGEKLLDCGSGVAATVDGPGTGDGFELFCDGDTDISDASRPISDDEITACEEGGIEFIELKVAVDGISVLTNSANEAIDCLSFADLYALIGPESEGFKKWSDAQSLADELGSDTEFPNANLSITAPGAESGTYDSFLEIVFGDIAEEREQDETARPDYASQADDTAIIAGIEGSDSSLGWVGFAFAEEAGDKVKEIAIAEEPGGDCIEPTAETIASNEYPISRDLFIYVNAAAAEENEAVAAYVDFYLSDAGIASVSEVGYVDLDGDSLEATRSTWADRTTGSNV